MNKRNYQAEMEQLILSFDEGEKPRLLLHVCCAPCSSSVLEQLYPHFDVTIYYFNPNIDTSEEHEKRTQEAERFIGETGWASQVIATPYEPNLFYEQVKGLEKEREGGARCERCFRLRLAQAARYAKENSYDFFTTTLSVSPYKNAPLLNALGEEYAKAEGIRYLTSDFKKKNGYLRSVELSKEHEMYRQDYCGCVFSKKNKQEMHE